MISRPTAGTSAWCSTCRTYHRPDAHLDRWRVWCPGEPFHEAPESAADVPGRDAREAAERWADEIDCEGQGPMIEASPFHVLVSGPIGGPPVRVRLECEATVTTTAELDP